MIFNLMYCGNLQICFVPYLLFNQSSVSKSTIQRNGLRKAQQFAQIRYLHFYDKIAPNGNDKTDNSFITLFDLCLHIIDMCWGFRRSHRKIALPKHLDQDPYQLVEGSSRKGLRRAKNNKSYKSIRLKQTQREKHEKAAKLLSYKRNAPADLYLQLKQLKQAITARRPSTKQSEAFLEDEALYSEYDETIKKYDEMFSGLDYETGIDIAMKQLERRQKLGPFRGHRGKGKQTYRRYTANEIFFKEAQEEEDDQWYCPTCHGDIELGYLAQQYANQLNNQTAEECLEELVEPGVMRFCDQALKKLRKKDMVECQWLNFNQTFATDSSLKYLSLGIWDGLRFLYLGRNKITNAGCKYLARTYLPELSKINLGENQISAEGIHYLSKAQWPQLFHFSMNSCRGLPFLLKGNFPCLKQIQLCLMQTESNNANTLFQDLIGTMKHAVKGAFKQPQLTIFIQLKGNLRNLLSRFQFQLLNKIYKDRNYYIEMF